MVVSEHYQRPGWFTSHVFNPLVAGLTRLGLSLYGSRVLEVQGRKSGQWRQTPVNLLRFDGADYLVAPRGGLSGEEPSGERTGTAQGRTAREHLHRNRAGRG